MASVSSLVVEAITGNFFLGTLIIYGFTTIYVFFITELQFQALRLMHRFGILRRFQETLPQDRHLFQSWIGISSVALPTAVYRSYYSVPLLRGSTAEVNVVDIIALQLVLLVCVDTWYYWGHRFMHRNKFCWNYIHSQHHEMKNLNVYATSYASFFENLFLIAPVIILVTHGYMMFCDAYQRPVNRLAIALAFLGQNAIFHLGHSGMRQHWSLYLLAPPTSSLQKLFGRYSLITDDHEGHHLCPNTNFALNFRFWDLLLQTYRPLPDTPQATWEEKSAEKKVA